MKTNTLSLIALLCVTFSFSQKTTDDTEQVENIKTTVIEINLSSPTPQSVYNSNGKKRLVVSNRNPLAVKLTNGNPFKYDYVLNYEKVDLFGTGDFSLKPKPKEEIDNSDSDQLNYYMAEDTNDLTAEELFDLISENFVRLQNEISTFMKEMSNAEYLDKSRLKKKREALKDELNDIEINLNKFRGAESIVISEEEKEDFISYHEKAITTVKTKIEKFYSVDTESYLLPLDINGDNIDYISIRLEIFDKENPTTPKVYNYKVWLKGGLKIDVSGGGFITSLFDSEYTINDAGDGTGMKTIRKNDVGRFDFGFGAMVNISLRGGSWVRPTLNFGTILTSNQKFQILAGGGFILGKNERIIISGGLTMGRVNILDDSFIADGSTAYDLGTTGEVPTNEKFKFGHFFGITYNFSKPKSGKE